MPVDQPTDARARLLSHFNSAKGSTEHGTKWDELWTEGFLPWDKGFPNPALVDLLSQRQDILPTSTSPNANGQASKKKKALVPGCGKGNDVLLLSAFGYDAYGLEISSKALEEARKVEAEVNGKDIYAAREGFEKGEVHWIVGDFFEEGGEGILGGEKFDLIYDYTVSIFSSMCSSSELFFMLTVEVLMCSTSRHETSVVETLRRSPCARRKSRLRGVPNIQAAINWRASLGIASSSVFSSFDETGSGAAVC